MDFLGAKSFYIIVFTGFFLPAFQNSDCHDTDDKSEEYQNINETELHGVTLPFTGYWMVMWIKMSQKPDTVRLNLDKTAVKSV